MWGAAFRRSAGVACCRLAFVPMERRQLDLDKISNPIVRDPNSSIDRVLKIFDRDEHGTISPEAAYINMFGFLGAMIGGINGGLLYSRMTNLTFRECNDATVFESHGVAQRKMLDTMTLSFSRGAVRFGIRYGIFCFAFSGFTTILSRYRGKDGILEFSLGGLVTGALYKFALGPKGMISGAFFGCLIGSFGGCCIYILTKTTGIKMDDAYDLAKSYFIYKDQSIHGSAKVQKDRKDFVLDKFPEGVDTQTPLHEFGDIRSVSELKYNKNISLKLNPNESNQSVNSTEKKK